LRDKGSEDKIVLACNTGASEFFGMIRLGPDRLPHSRAIAVAAGIGSALVLAIGSLFIPAVQRSLLRKALVSSGAGQVSIGRFSAGPTGMSLEGLQFERNGFRVEAGNLSVRIMPSRLARGRVVVTECVGRNLDCFYDFAGAAAQGEAIAIASSNAGIPSRDAAAPPRSAAPAPQEVFDGLLKSFHLPASIGGVDLSGRLNLLRGAETLAVCSWQIKGGGVAPGSEGALNYSIETSSPGTAASGPWRSGGTDRRGEIFVFVKMDSWAAEIGSSKYDYSRGSLWKDCGKNCRLSVTSLSFP